MNPYTLADAEADLFAAFEADDTNAIGALLDLVDKLDVHPPTPSLHASALWYAEQGLKIFPLQPMSKVPMKHSRGCKDGTTDREQVTAWWTATPDANIGIATGHLVDVIDIDGPLGVESYCKIIDELPTIYGKVLTPRPGGQHLYVAAVPGRGNKAGLLPGLDYRGDGGYVVAPPSVNEQGRYEWLRPLDVTALVRAVAA